MMSSPASKPVGRVCGGVIVVAVGACVGLAAARSEGVTGVTVTALDPAAEPRDHAVPLVRRREALPDYRVTLVRASGTTATLATRYNTSAAGGLSWRVDPPVPLFDLASVRLEDEDKLSDDRLADVSAARLRAGPVTEGNYRLEVTTARSFGAGLEAFFATPAGRAILAALGLAVLVLAAKILAG